MSVIAELTVAPDEFELGRILELDRNTTVVLETMVPLGENPVPFLRVHDADRNVFEESVGGHPSVKRLQKVDTHDGETLYALDWIDSRDHLFTAMRETKAQLTSARGAVDGWHFEIRFPSHDALSQFKELCDDAHLTLTVDRIYNPTKPGSDSWYGLTPQQREALTHAVREGYYSIPREISTKELAAAFGISDQAITERLRRGIIALVEHTLLLDEEKADGADSFDDDDD